MEEFLGFQRAEYRFPALLTEVEEVCCRFKHQLETWGGEISWFPIHLVLREILNNAVIHGSSSDSGKTVTFIASREGPLLRVTVKDQGPGFPWEDAWAAQAQDDQDHGRGMPILKAYTKDVKFNPLGNEIELVMELKEALYMLITQKGEWTSVTPQKDVVSSAATQLRAELRRLVEEGKKFLEVDLKEVEMMDSMGLGLLIALHNTLKEQGGKIRVVNLSQDLMELFKNMRLDRHFELTSQ